MISTRTLKSSLKWTEMTEKRAKYVSIFMMAASAFLALNYTFFEQDIILTLVSISGFFTFQFAMENPKLLMSASWKEFGEHADLAKGKNKLIGTPGYFAAVFLSVLYIILV